MGQKKKIQLTGYVLVPCHLDLYHIHGFQVHMLQQSLCTCTAVHTFLPFLLAGKTETTVDKLRSILAQMEYSYQVRSWNEKGVPFRTHIYVPEVHHLTGKRFHEREDEAHVFKVNEMLFQYLHRCMFI